MAFRPEKLQAAGRDILKEPVSLCRQFHAGFTADEEAAAQVGYDKHYFCWKFKVVTGITYVNYVNQLRIDRACALLRGGMDVRQAGEQCGIENDSYFSALFKRIMGVTPKQYRLQSAAFPENGR